MQFPHNRTIFWLQPEFPCVVVANVRNSTTSLALNQLTTASALAKTLLAISTNSRFRAEILSILTYCNFSFIQWLKIPYDDNGIDFMVSFNFLTTKPSFGCSQCPIFNPYIFSQNPKPHKSNSNSSNLSLIYASLTTINHR